MTSANGARLLDWFRSRAQSFSRERKTTLANVIVVTLPDPSKVLQPSQHIDPFCSDDAMAWVMSDAAQMYCGLFGLQRTASIANIKAAHHRVRRFLQERRSQELVLVSNACTRRKLVIANLKGRPLIWQRCCLVMELHLNKTSVSTQSGQLAPPLERVYCRQL